MELFGEWWRHRISTVPSTKYLYIRMGSTGYVTSSSNDVLVPASKLGDATASDVLKGKTFTSINGVKITGTLKADQEYFINTTIDNVYYNVESNYISLQIQAGTINPSTSAGAGASTIYYMKSFSVQVFMPSDYRMVKVSFSNASSTLVNLDTGATTGGTNLPVITGLDVYNYKSKYARSGSICLSAIPALKDGEIVYIFSAAIWPGATSSFKVGSMYYGLTITKE